MLGAGEGGGVPLDGDDAFPPAGEGEGDDVAAGAAEDVDEGGLGGRGNCGEILGDSAVAGCEIMRPRMRPRLRPKEGESVLRSYGLRGNAKPCVVGEIDVVVII